MRGITAALRNLPTLVNIIAEDYQKLVLECQNTKAKELKKTLDDLTNAEILLFTIGLAQLLESYCEASLEAQFASHFPIQVLQCIDSAKIELEE